MPSTSNPEFRLSSRRFTVALSHDVDRVHKSFQSFTHFLKNARKGKLGEAVYQVRSLARPDSYWCFEKICEIEEAFKVRSTWFFLNETYPLHLLKPRSWRLALGYYDIFWPRVSHIIRQLEADGFEIGLHGSYRSYVDGNLLEKEKKDLESIVGHPILGIRQHYLNLAPQTWDIQKSLGFLYDASFGYRDRIGFKDDAFWLFPLDERNDFFIVPQAIMDSCLMRQEDPWDRASALIDLAENKRACLVLNWHQQIFDEHEFPGYSRMYIRILEECSNRGARFLTLGQLVQEHMAATTPVDASGHVES